MIKVETNPSEGPFQNFEAISLEQIFNGVIIEEDLDGVSSGFPQLQFWTVAQTLADLPTSAFNLKGKDNSGQFNINIPTWTALGTFLGSRTAYLNSNGPDCWNIDNIPTLDTGTNDPPIDLIVQENEWVYPVYKQRYSLGQPLISTNYATNLESETQDGSSPDTFESIWVATDVGAGVPVSFGGYWGVSVTFTGIVGGVSLNAIADGSSSSGPFVVSSLSTTKSGEITVSPRTVSSGFIQSFEIKLSKQTDHVTNPLNTVSVLWFDVFDNNGTVNPGGGPLPAPNNVNTGNSIDGSFNVNELLKLIQGS